MSVLADVLTSIEVRDEGNPRKVQFTLSSQVITSSHEVQIPLAANTSQTIDLDATTNSYFLAVQSDKVLHFTMDTNALGSYPNRLPANGFALIAGVDAIKMHVHNINATDVAVVKVHYFET